LPPAALVHRGPAFFHRRLAPASLPIAVVSPDRDLRH
jgi:hypothetical protein